MAGILRSQGKLAEARAELARIDEKRINAIPYYREMLARARASVSEDR